MRRGRGASGSGLLHRAVLMGLAALLSAGLARAAAMRPDAVTVRLVQGTLAGLRRRSVATFLGVPYAAPPIGRYRWRAPQPPHHWDGVRAARRFAPSCWQEMTPGGIGPWTHEYMPQGRTSEDCLYLNIWTPSIRPRRRMPVLVWVPGGGFVAGSGSAAVYDGARLAAQGIVVVTINYRVGLLGFFLTPALVQEAAREHEPPGNYGLQDVIAALQWVHRNIAAFGGDPDAITLGGQSAGSIAVHDLIVSPLATGLFRRAIAQSGLPDSVPAPSLAQAERAGEKFARSKGAASLSALRALTPRRLSAGAPAGMKGPLLVPVIDGVLLPAAPASLIAPGTFADVPILLGVDGDEATAFSAPLVKSLSRQAWQELLTSTFGALAPRFAPLYPAATARERARSDRQLHHDLGLGALLAWSRMRQPHASSPAYGYLFEHLEPGPDAGRWGVFHSSELPYVFDTLDAAPERHFTASDRALSRTLSRYWVNFIQTGDPNGPALPAWPPMAGADPRIMLLGDHPGARPILPPRKLQAMSGFIAAGGKPTIF